RPPATTRRTAHASIIGWQRWRRRRSTSSTRAGRVFARFATRQPRPVSIARAGIYATRRRVRRECERSRSTTPSSRWHATVRATPGEVRQAGDTLERKFMDVEAQLIDLRLTGRGQDEVRYPVKAAGQLNWLASGIGASDFGPTAQQRDVQTILAKTVRDTRASL